MMTRSSSIFIGLVKKSYAPRSTARAAVRRAAVGSHHDHENGRLKSPHFLEDVQPSGVGKTLIKQHEVVSGVGLGQQLECLGSGLGLVDRQAFASQRCTERVAHLRVVVDDEQPLPIHHLCRSGYQLLAASQLSRGNKASLAEGQSQHELRTALRRASEVDRTAVCVDDLLCDRQTEASAAAP